jgi:probable rRNA maturation factor
VSVAVDVAAEGVRVPLALRRVAELASGVLRAERVPAAMLSIAFVTDREIARLNRAHLGHRGPTDVISFGFAPTGGAAGARSASSRSPGPVIGDIYIAPGVARANARAHGAGVREEIARLVVHGTLHVLGYEHPTDDGRAQSAMWRRQEALLARLFTPRRR